MMITQMPKPTREKKPYDAFAVIITAMISAMVFTLLCAGVVFSVKLLIRTVVGD